MAENILNSQNASHLSGDEVVISGISGLFPNSNSVFELMENLYNKVDMVTADDISIDHADLPKYSGKISGIHKFDAQFFRVTHKQADTLEPMVRKVMEQAYCAMFDAGVNPIIYKGKKIGVFTATLYAESIKLLISKNNNTNSFLMSGCSKAMLSNRISYWLDAKGPSYTLESFSGSMECLKNAYDCIMTGLCEAAIVGGCEFTNDEVLSINLRNAGLHCMDGKTKCFDKSGDGYVKSQAVGVIFLQKAKDAKRIYAEVCKIGMGCDYGVEFNRMSDPENVVNFLENLYAESGVSPNEVEYIEAHGAASPKADSCELQAISQVFAKEKPIKVGCIKSNIGGTEAVSGICAIIKLCLAYHKGELAGNLHYNDPLDIPSIKENKVEVLTNNTPFNRTFSAVNHFSLTGTNCHVVLKGHFKPKNPTVYKISIPRLVPISGRHEEGVKKVFNILRSQPIDAEFLGMLQDIYQIDTPAFTYRGFIILDSKDDKTVSLAQSMKLYQGTQRPLCFVYSGMGSQWAGMGTELMRIPLLAASIEKCRKILEPKGVDIVRILTAPDETIFDNVLNSFVGIAAVQIALTDLIKEIGLIPNYIIGHSLGELGCAYIDSCMSAEEMILSAYARGLVSVQTKLIKGSMAAIGLGYKDMLPLCPPEIDIACRNSFNSCTISGPADLMKTFVKELKAKGIFAKEVHTGNIAYHSRYIEKAGASFLKIMKNIIKKPVERSDRWISTSWSEEKRDKAEAKFSSAEYHTNNLLSPVYFEEAAKLIPHNAVVVEIAPHGLLQAILKKSHPECSHISLTRRGHANPLQFLFEAFGKLYQEGFDIKVDRLYPKIQYPVSTETSLLSHFVEWYHEEDWTQRFYTAKSVQKSKVPSRNLTISVQDNDFKFLVGHRRGGNIVLPEAAVIFYVWETLAMYKGVNHSELSVAFHDVQFYAENIIDVKKTINLQFSINKGNNYFEVKRDNNIMIANGIVEALSFKFRKMQENYITSDEIGAIQLTSDDVYNIMKIKGHYYEKEFKSIHSSSSRWNSSFIKMTGNWITFLDSLFQLNILAREYDAVSAPKLIKNISINMIGHENARDVKTLENGMMIYEANFDKYSGVTKCGGIKIHDLIFNDRRVNASEPDIMDLYSSGFAVDQINQTHNEVSSRIVTETDNNMQFKLIQTNSGHKEGLKWIEVETNKKNVVKVFFAALSTRDVQIAMNLFETDEELGMDFSGIDSIGNRVMGLVAGGAISNMVNTDNVLLWPVPKHWTLEEAATVPLPYVLAYYCLTIRAQIQPNNFVFVTRGAEALGQALISICLSLGCTVYTSVGDIREKKLLQILFPNLNENNIGYCHNMNFYNILITESRKKRDSMVINCETGHLRELAMKCVSPGGYFIDVSNYDMLQNEDFGMIYLREYKTYAAVDISSIFKPDNVTERQFLHQMVVEGITNGTVKPISHNVYCVDELDKAIRLSSIGHRGRALIMIGNSKPPRVLPRFTYSDGAYLIICDDNTNLGIQLVTHLVKHGARNLILHLKFKRTTACIEVHLRHWKSLGANVTTSTENLQITKNCVDIISSAGLLSGIFVLTPSIKDTIALNKQNFTEPYNTVSTVINNLDGVSRNNCPDLKYFVILTPSPICNDNRHMILIEKICEMRANIGLPALFIRTHLLDDGNNVQHPSFRPMTVPTALRAMEICLKKKYINCLAYNEKINNSVFIKRVASILGINNMDTIEKDLCVKDLLPNVIEVHELKTLIRNSIHIDLPIECIQEMTICSLKDIGGNKEKPRNGLSTFFAFVDADIIEATEKLVSMFTLSKADEDQENLKLKAGQLFLVPGFEGHHYIFKEMCEGLKIQAISLQFGPDVANKSVHKIAIGLKQEILKRRFILEPQFYLLGYSFGVNVALEMAALLEKDGLVGTVFCLDSSPDNLRLLLDQHFGNLSEDQIQNYIIRHLFYIMTGQEYGDLEEDTKSVNNWEEKVDTCVARLNMYVRHSNEYKQDVIKGFYTRIGLARNYNPKFKLESKIVLLKGMPTATSLPADYGLSKFAKNPVQVINIDSDMALSPYDNKVPNFVNNLITN